MQNSRVQHRFQKRTGSIFFTLGLLGESIIGVLFLARGDLQLLLLHVPAALLWASGISLMDRQHIHHERAIRIGRVHLHKWSIAALLLSLSTFPGLGSLAYSIGLFAARLLHERVALETPEVAVLPRELPPPLDLEVQPLVDILHMPDLAMRRAAVAVLSRQVTPEGIQLLRQLLSDVQPEIRSDASIALTRLEEELAGALNASLALSTANQADKELQLSLADQYYEYARSNVLDKASQRYYFAKASDILQSCIAQDEMNADLWLKLARIHHHLDETAEALQDVCRAIQFCPHSAEAYLLAMELAFRLHDWEVLISLACEGLKSLPSTSEARTTLQWWLVLHPKVRGGRLHG